MACCFKPRSTTDGSCGSDTSYPVVSANVAALPLIQLPTQLRHADLLTVGRTISSVDPAFVSQKLHLQGVAVKDNPLDHVLAFQDRVGAQRNPHVEGCLTATYPEVEEEDGQSVITNYPNQDAFFNHITRDVAYGGTFDGCGGTGAREGWLGSHLAMATAMRVLSAGTQSLSTSHDAARLLDTALRRCHEELVKYDEHGSTTALLHLCLRVSEKRFLYFFACLGDVEVMWHCSRQRKWRYLVEVKGPGSSSLRLDAAQMPACTAGDWCTSGAIGAVAADKYEPTRLRSRMNLQYGMLKVEAADILLMASDGLWDTLDPCQSGPPQLLRQSLGIRVDSDHDWDQVARDAELANQIGDRIPVLKAAKLNEVAGEAAARGDVEAVVQLAVGHAMEATRGQREVFGLYKESMHESGPDGRSPFQVAKAAAQDRGEHIFAKPDHLGIQAFSPAAMNYRPLPDKLKAKAAVLQKAFVCNATVPRTRSTELPAGRTTPPELAHRLPSV